jgi:hypothetical protein
MVIAGSEFLDQQKKSNEEERHRKLKEQVAWLLKYFYEDHPIVRACQANDNLIVEWLGGPDLVTKEHLEIAWNEHPKFKNRLARYHSDEDLRDDLLKQIHNMVQGSPEARQHVVTQAKFKPTADLIIQRDGLARKIKMQNLSKEELREIVKGDEPGQWEPLPEQYRSRKALVSASPELLRRLIRTSGVDEINKYLKK